MGRGRLTLAPPENAVWLVDYLDEAGEEEKLELRLRVFNAADVGRLQAAAGKDWADAIVQTTNVELAIELLAAQVENAEEVLAHFEDEDDLAVALKRFIPLQDGVLEGLMAELVGLWNIAVNGEAGRAAAKKRRRKRKILLMTGLTALSSALLALLTALYLSMTL